MEITARALKEIYVSSMERDIDRFLEPLNVTIKRFGIGAPYELPAYLAQIGHESAELRCLCENLNYSADALKRLFNKYFAAGEAEKFAYRPEKIANRIYAGRMGNGAEESGDGWRYRGRGLIQLTGKRNYALLSDAFGKNFLGDPDMLLQPLYAALSSGWFWQSNGIGVLCSGLRESVSEREAFRKITKRINGGYNGEGHRWELYLRAKKILG